MSETSSVNPLDMAVILVYFVAVVGFGLWFGRYTKSTKDFFLGGQRFAWWLIAFSSIATMVGSYSFIKYSAAGYRYGLSSAQSYLNDWYWMPILIVVWLPIIYFARIQSVPEYFERRFGTGARVAATFIILVYLVGYVGVNLYTTGVALNSLLGWPIMYGASITALIVMCYMFAGGQTSVIMTDLAQGIILLVAGVGLFLAGVMHFGGFVDFWALLPKDHKYIFSEFDAPPKFSFIGIYAQDGLANTGAFMLMNQGMIMRFLSLRSVHDARKMAIAWILILAPLACVAVAGGGWIARALVNNGDIAALENPNDAFVKAAQFLCIPGVFGFVLAAVTAALMSTADTLVTAVSSIFINDVYRPYVAPGKKDRHYLNTARISSMVTIIVGLFLVKLFMKQESIYQAHALFTAAVTPPIVVAILYGIFWKRYTSAAAIATMVGGGALIAVSLNAAAADILIRPFSFGMGPDSYSYMRALYGLVVSGVLGFVVTWFTKPRPESEIIGLVNGMQVIAMELYKGGPINRRIGKKARLTLVMDDTVAQGECVVGGEGLAAMAAETGDLLYAQDPRWWFGGLRSVHVHAATASEEAVLRLHPEDVEDAHFTDGQVVVVEKLM